MATVPTEERVSSLEGAYDHLATKADVANLKVWILTSVLTGAGLVIAVLKLWPS